jgi:predicted nucleic acid-binding protein
VFLAWIKQERGWPADVTQGIEQTIEQVYGKQLVVATSVITLAEVLTSRLTQKQKEQFRDSFKCPNLQLLDVDRRISEKASVIRGQYDTRVFKTDGSISSGSIMSMGDAIHLATAIQYDVTEFQTLDGSGKRKRRTDLLKLSGDIAGAYLRIVQPKYIEPLTPLEGPLTSIDSRQATFFEEEGNGKSESETKAITASTEVRRGGFGPTESRADAKAQEKAEGKEARKK